MSFIINYIVWNANPEIFRLGNFAIRWYGLFFAISFVLGYLLMSKMLKNENKDLKQVDIMLTYMFVGTVVGARLGHCLFYQPDIYLKNPLEILKIWEGGLASHGGAIGILISFYVYARKYKVPLLWVLDRIVILISLGAFFVRMGNLMNSEIIGKATNVNWAFVFASVDNIPRHPTQIYEGLCYLFIFVILFNYYNKKSGNPKTGIIFGVFLILLFGVRFVIEFFKEVQVDFENSMKIDMGQLLSIPFIIAGIIILIIQLRNKKTLNNLS